MGETFSLTSVVSAKRISSVAVSGSNCLSNSSIVVIGEFSDELFDSSANTEGVSKAVINAVVDRTLNVLFFHIILQI
jgi:hypothetical protein